MLLQTEQLVLKPRVRVRRWAADLRVSGVALIHQCKCREAFGNAAEVEYRWVREYDYEVKRENDLQQEYVLRFQPSGVFYTKLGPRLTLRKRSKHKGAMQEITRPTKVHLHQTEIELQHCDKHMELVDSAGHYQRLEVEEHKCLVTQHQSLSETWTGLTSSSAGMLT